ncbi:hypothetical protein LSH36_232g03024 [Paralvinella palmiformis]|uniref:Uncharacterized protein n=1 Tax=Paralvinella palmiformis TaxID=53620 RepID=A0AAD9JME9_9ANNE|nr:hypothetical protein LSH36_232g03024 [Paralvinella palmiformis]
MSTKIDITDTSSVVDVGAVFRRSWSIGGSPTNIHRHYMALFSSGHQRVVLMLFDPIADWSDSKDDTDPEESKLQLLIVLEKQIMPSRKKALSPAVTIVDFEASHSWATSPTSSFVVQSSFQSSSSSSSMPSSRPGGTIVVTIAYKESNGNRPNLLTLRNAEGDNECEIKENSRNPELALRNRLRDRNEQNGSSTYDINHRDFVTPEVENMTKHSSKEQDNENMEKKYAKWESSGISTDLMTQPKTWCKIKTRFKTNIPGQVWWQDFPEPEPLNPVTVANYFLELRDVG